MANILLLTDSHGMKIQPLINDELRKTQSTARIEVKSLRGGNINSVTEMGEKILKNHRHQACYLFAGVNNLTTKVETRYSVFNYNDIPSMVEEMTDKYEQAQYKLKLKVPYVVICHLIGLDFVKYNKLEANAMSEDQNILNQSVYHINHAINAMNADSNVIGPWISDSIHANIHGRHVHKYNKFSDGLHPDIITCRQWAKIIVKSCSTLPA